LPERKGFGATAKKLAAQVQLDSQMMKAPDCPVDFYGLVTL
jgi:hypothetical protein